jgi:YHS domain-containing protein
MFRAIFELLLTAVVILFLRAVIGIVMKGFGQTMRPPIQPQRGPRPANESPRTRELKKDPVCGTYIATDTSIHETVGGQTFYFCSRQCRDKYVASLAR